MNKKEIKNQLVVANMANDLADNNELKALTKEIDALHSTILGISNIENYENAKKAQKALLTKTNKFITENIKPIKKALKYLKDDFIGEIEKSLTNRVKEIKESIEDVAVLNGVIVKAATPETPKTEKVAYCIDCGSHNIGYKLLEVK